jgi:hypothetical protein
MLTVRKLLDTFELKFRAGQARGLQDSAFLTFSAERLRACKAAVMNTAELIYERTRATGALMDLDVLPFCRTLDIWCRQAHPATEHLPGSTNVACTNVRLVVSVATDLRCGSRAGKRVGPNRTEFEVLPAWRPGFLALREDSSGHKRVLWLRMQDVCVRNGAATPEQVPDDYDVVRGWLTKDGLTMNEVNATLIVWRKARGLTGSLLWPELFRVADDACRGLRSLPNRRVMGAERAR